MLLFTLMIPLTTFATEVSEADEIKMLEDSLSETITSLESDPNNLELKKNYITGLALLKKWDEIALNYPSIAKQLKEEEKEAIDFIILYIRTKQIVGHITNNEQDNENDKKYNFTIILEYLTPNVLAKLTEEEKTAIFEHIILGQELFQKNLIEEGKQEFYKSSKIKETAIAYLYSGVLLNMFGHSEEAIVDLKKCMALADKGDIKSSLYEALANAYKNKGEPSQAMIIFKKRLNEKPNDLLILYRLAYLYLEQGANKKFIKTCEKIKTLDNIVFALVKDDYNTQIKSITK